ESGGEIAWVSGIQIAESFRITEATERVVVLQVVEPERASAAAPGTLIQSGRVLYPAARIADAVARLGEEGDAWAAGQEIFVLGILQGSFVFLADLVRRLTCPVTVGFLDREGNVLSGPESFHGVRVLVVEDILDTGRSLQIVLEKVRAKGPVEVR